MSLIKGLKYREVRSAELEKAECYILEGLDNWMSCSFSKNVIEYSILSFQDEAITLLANDLYVYEDTDCLYPDVKMQQIIYVKITWLLRCIKQVKTFFLFLKDDLPLLLLEN